MTDPRIHDEAHRLLADPTQLVQQIAGQLDGAPQRFEVLHYPGDVTAAAVPGSLLGSDEFGRPFEVLDAEVEQIYAPGHFDGDGCTFPDAGHLDHRTTVHLQYASPENIVAAMTARMAGVA